MLTKNCEQCNRFYSDKKFSCNKNDCWVRNQKEAKLKNNNHVLMFVLMLIVVGFILYAADRERNISWLTQQNEWKEETIDTMYRYQNLYENLIDDHNALQFQYDDQSNKYSELWQKYDSLMSTPPKRIYIEKRNFSSCEIECLRMNGEL